MYVISSRSAPSLRSVAAIAESRRNSCDSVTACDGAGMVEGLVFVLRGCYMCYGVSVFLSVSRVYAELGSAASVKMEGL